MRLPTLRAFTAAFALFMVLGYVPARAEPLVIAVSNSTLSLPVWVAQELNLFKKHQVDLILKDCFGGNRCLQMVLEKKADIATCTDIPFLQRVLEGANIEYLASMSSNSNDSGVVVRIFNKSGNEAKVKPGMTIGTVWGTSAHYYLDLFLTFHLIDPTQIKVVNIPANELKTALSDGKVDGIAFWQPHRSDIVQHDPEAFRPVTTPRLLATSFDLIADRHYTKNNQQNTINMLKALSEAVAYIHAHPDESKAIMRSKLPEITPSSLDRQWVDLEFEVKIPQLLPRTLNSQAEWMQKIGLVSKGAALPKISEHINSALLHQSQQP